MRLVFIRLSTSLRRRLGAPIPSNPMRWSSSRRSRTPRMKAPCALPPCSARLISPAPLCGRRPVGAPRRLDRLTRNTSCLLPIGAPARLAGAPVVRRECTEPYWRPEMPRGYDADARRLSRLRRHGNLSRAQDGGISIRGTLRECRRSIPPRGDRNSSGARRRFARVPPSSGA